MAVLYQGGKSMSQADAVYDYLRHTYGENEPIFLKEVHIPGMADASVRQALKRLTDLGKMKRYDRGIYFFPKAFKYFRSGTTLSFDDVLTKLYLKDASGQCGYVSGLILANWTGLTTQVPMEYVVYTNKATTDYRKTSLIGIRIILRRPYVPICEGNAHILQFLDLLKDVLLFSEVQGAKLTEGLRKYMEDSSITFADMAPYLPFYPRCTSKTIVELGLYDAGPAR